MSEGLAIALAVLLYGGIFTVAVLVVWALLKYIRGKR